MNTNRGRKFLVVRTDRLGDLILSLPVLTALKEAHPGCHVTLLTSPPIAPIVNDYPDLDEVLVDEVEGQHHGITGWFRLVRSLRKRAFDAAVLLHPTLRLALALAASVPQRVGTAYRAYSFLFTERVPVHRKAVPRHELDLNLDLVAPLAPRPSRVAFKIPKDPETEARVTGMLGTWLTSAHKLVVIHPGSGGSARDWPVEHFARLADRLSTELHAAVVITGTAGERPLVDRLYELCRQKPLRLDGRTTLKELAALVSMADLVISNSTGPLHLAVAMGTEVVGLYCRMRACGPERWGPYGRLDSVLTPEVEPCDHCTGAKCPHWDCMAAISVDQAFALAARKLAASHSRHRTSR
ncbi:MAG: glycosyltransferase family 9 protein [candidate division KSB1 bacterium]|nr:glycosyltransferase family 9 protein [candidate division KSB1 bacterium]